VRWINGVEELEESLKPPRRADFFFEVPRLLFARVFVWLGKLRHFDEHACNII
jgi:hypothetical protein